MEITPDKRKLVGLVEQAYLGKLCLPNFQRDFVWTRDEVADLLRSVLRGYFVGSLLLLRCDPARPPFAPIGLRGARPREVDLRPDFLVLDGQQRLTALLYALSAPDLPLKDSRRRRWFFIDLAKLLKDPADDGIVVDRHKGELDGLDRPSVQFERRMLPCTLLLPDADFLGWRDGLDDWVKENQPDAYREFKEQWRTPLSKAVQDFQNFNVTLVELPLVKEGDADAIGRVCAIFEKLNSTGVELSVYDLLTARLFRSGIDLHALWKKSCDECPRLNEWSGGKADTHKFGVLVLRTLALLRGLDPKPRILIDLDPSSFPEDWDRAAKGMERALQLVTMVGPDGFGVFAEKWLPGYGLLPVLAALRSEVESRRLGDRERADVRRWYWCSLFLERYSSAVESKSRKDYADMLAWWEHGRTEPALFAEARAVIGAPGYSIRHAASFASSIYSGTFCVLALRGARDWKRGEDIRLQDLEDHHIFPRAYLRRHEIVAKDEVNTILNRTLISDETNGLIKDAAPAGYLADARVFPTGTTGALLAPHFIDAGGLAAAKTATEALTEEQLRPVYEPFLKAREAEILAEIRTRCGVLTAVAETTSTAVAV
jgi:hypothetical protein